MRRLWLAGQVMMLGVAFLWVASGSGCGAKSQLFFVEEEGEDPPIDPPEDLLPLDCEHDFECDDGEFCNGEEECIDNTCEMGEPIECGDGDECHMEYCDEDRDSCIEMLIAEDLDGDGFYGRPCGEDCFDDDAQVHPGAQERCNGIDDDCDGLIDEDLIEACEDFGRRICIDGEWSDCLHCTVCMPGASRFCDTPTYCSWGRQICNDRGDDWGECFETSAPSGCAGTYFDMECCLRSSSCCQDYFDTDNDGDYDESFGACEDVVCPSAG